MPSPRRSILLDLSPLRSSPAFARLYLGNLVAGVGSQMTIVAVSLEVYDRTASTFAVGMIGVAALVPAIVFGLYGGALADAFDRRRVGIVTAIITWASTAMIAAHSWLGWDHLWLLYVLTAINASGTSVLQATRSAIIPRLLPASLIPAASALTGVQMGLTVTLGPALAGLLVASVGYGPTYAVDVVLYSALFVGLFTLPSLPPAEHMRAPGLRSVVDGVRYLRQVPHVSAGFLLDIAAMAFGSPRVLMPAAGAVVLGGGAATSGLLLAAPAVGTMVCSLLSGRLGGVRRQGRALALAVMAYGASVLAFGVVLAGVAVQRGDLWAGSAGDPGEAGATTASAAWIIAAAVCLMFSGASDNISMVFRQTMLQTTVPDQMRGRMQGIFTVVVSGGPRVGDLYAGTLATVIALWAPGVIGGLAIIVAVFVVLRVFRGLWGYRAAVSSESVTV